VPSSSRCYRDAAFYDTNVAADGTLVLGRLALADDLLRSAELPNMSVTLLPRVRSGVHRIRRMLGSASRRVTLSKLLPAGGHGWSRHPSPARVFDGFIPLLNLEQRPHPDNRVVLGTRRDSFGVRVPELHWRWREEEQQARERARALVTRELEAAGFGRVHIDAAACIDPNAHHHAGTTRMHNDPSLGVVNRDGRVHALENLYVAGASVFPTAGFANPTLTIVALAARMADHLSSGV
jgi:choline dehydrogenase-like flavoprotein